MKKTLLSSIFFGVLILMFITACATTQLTAVWKDPVYAGQPHKIMVIGVAKNPLTKRLFEDEFVRQLKAHGVDAVASYTVMPDWKQEDRAVIAAKVKELGADAVLISRLVSKKTVQTYMPGSVYYPPDYYGNCWNYYEYCSQAVYTPGYTAEEEFALMESNLYNSGNDKLIWSATSETELQGSNKDQIKSYIGVMINAMIEKKLLR